MDPLNRRYNTLINRCYSTLREALETFVILAMSAFDCYGIFFPCPFISELSTPLIANNISYEISNPLTPFRGIELRVFVLNLYNC